MTNNPKDLPLDTSPLDTKEEEIRNSKFEIRNSSPIILALDTSSKTTSMAITRGDRVLVTYKADFDETRSERLWIEIESLLDSCDLKIKEVDLFAVCVGPGGFTGLRVGLAAAKGLAAAAGKPIVGVTSLEVLAFAGGPAPAACAMVAAYKGDLYSQLFSFDSDGLPVPANGPMAGTLEETLARLSDLRPILFVGFDAGSAIEDRAPAPGSWTALEPPECLAEPIARLAHMRFVRGEVDTPESLRACYVRQAEAEINLAKGLLGSKIKRVLGREEPV
jgi:tRNA threonylcarbamoyladenosine biosynthesis protein TsaB